MKCRSRICSPRRSRSRIPAPFRKTPIARPNPGRIYNVCDDDPAPPEDIIAHAARLTGLPVPPAEDFDAAAMTPMARSFYAENKRVRNDRIKTELGVALQFPDYRSGLRALAQDAD